MSWIAVRQLQVWTLADGWVLAGGGAAVSERTAQALVEEQEQQSDLNTFAG